VQKNAKLTRDKPNFLLSDDFQTNAKCNLFGITTLKSEDRLGAQIIAYLFSKFYIDRSPNSDIVSTKLPLKRAT